MKSNTVGTLMAIVTITIVSVSIAHVMKKYGR